MRFRDGSLALLLILGCGSDGGELPYVEHAVPGAGPALWVFGPDDVWVGGGRPQHFDGAAWTETPLPLPGGYIADFWGFAPDELWAVVRGDRPGVVRWDGATWSTVRELSNARATLHAIWGSSPTDVWIAGADADPGLAAHWDGTAWTQHPVATRGPITDLWGSGPDDVWAIGEPRFDEPGISRWDGAAWTSIAPAETGHAGFFAGWGAGRDDVWLVDDFGTWTHFDGVAWTSDARVHGASGIWGVAADAIWAVGSPAGNSGTATLSRYDGVTWTAQDLPAGSAGLRRVHGSSATEVWLGGEDRVMRLDP